VQQKEKYAIDDSTLPPVVRHYRSMDQHALERLGHYIVSRRVALGYRNRTDLADSLQFTVRTLSDVENGVRKASPGTYAMLENKLAWAPGSIDTILAGGEPKELVVKLRRDSPEPRHQSYSTDAFSRASTEELLLELRRRIIQPRRRRHETWDDWDDGLEPHGSWPEEN
jgi:hypothetical protein